LYGPSIITDYIAPSLDQAVAEIRIYYLPSLLFAGFNHFNTINNIHGFKIAKQMLSRFFCGTGWICSVYVVRK